MEVNIVCPSRKRADHVLTKSLFPDMTIIVRQDELKTYKKHNPEMKVIATPKHVNNIAKTRQWILDNYENVFMIDDDVTGMYRTYVEKGEESRIFDPELAYEIVREHANIAKQMGAKVWGYQSIRNPNEYNAHRPFRHTGYLNNSYIGFLPGHNLTYMQDFGEAEDYYITCLQILKNRYAFIDRRFTFHTKDNFLAQGGVNDTRTIDMVKANTLRLRRLFGECVQIKRATPNKQHVHEGERSLVFPF